MKIFRILILIFIFKVGTVLSQQNMSICDINNEDSIYLLDTVMTNKYNLITKILKDELIILDNSFIKNSNYFVYNVFLPERGVKHKVLIPDSIWDARNRIVDFDISESNIFLLQGGSLFVFIMYDSSYYFFKQVDLKNTCYYLTTIEDELIAYHSGLYSGKTDSLSETYIKSIDKKTFELKTQTYVNPKGISWMKLQPRKLIDINNNFIAISDATNYNIRIINRHTALIDTLTREPKSWVKPQSVKTLKDNSAPYQNQDLVESLSKRSLIQRVHFLSNDLFIVAWTSPPKEVDYYYDIYFDIWVIDSSTKIWKLKYSDLENCLTEPVKFDLKNLILKSFHLSGNSILSIHHIPYETSPFLGKNYYDVLRTFEDYYRTNKPRYSIIRKKIK